MGSGATALKRYRAQPDEDSVKTINKTGAAGSTASWFRGGKQQANTGVESPPLHEGELASTGVGSLPQDESEPDSTEASEIFDNSATEISERPDPVVARAMNMTRLKQTVVQDSQSDEDLPTRRSSKRKSLADGPDWALPTEEIDPYKDLVQYQVYFRGDPFKALTNDWLEGMAGKETELEDDPHEAPDEDIDHGDESEQARLEREAKEAVDREKEHAREAEMERIEELLHDKGDGWKLWLRGRDLRSEFKEVRRLSSKGEEKRQESKAQDAVWDGKSWIRAPHDGKSRTRTVNGKSWIRAPLDARAPKKKFVCWRKDFVDQVLIDANLLRLERPTIPAERVRELARLDWNVLDQFYYHIEAVDLDGNRELWSPTFVGYIWEYWQRSQLRNNVQMSEAALEEQANNEGLKGLGSAGLSQGLFPRKPVKWPKPVWKPPCVKVPSGVFHILDQPDLPPLPRRFQHHVFYKEGPLERKLAKYLEGTEAWDAMLGTSDRLQAGARAVLHAEKFERRLDEIDAEREARARGLLPADEPDEEHADELEEEKKSESELPLTERHLIYRRRPLADIEQLTQAPSKQKPRRKKSLPRARGGDVTM